MAQEAIRNIRSHARANAVDVRVRVQGPIAILNVLDDGDGFAPDVSGTTGVSKHFGLRLMHDLSDHAGGRLRVESSPGHGTSVQLEVPIP